MFVKVSKALRNMTNKPNGRLPRLPTRKAAKTAGKPGSIMALPNMGSVLELSAFRMPRGPMMVPRLQAAAVAARVAAEEARAAAAAAAAAAARAQEEAEAAERAAAAAAYIPQARVSNSPPFFEGGRRRKNRSRKIRK